MIDSIKVQNFKCFSNLQLTLSNLNLFSGINSMGKSTLIQSLLLLRQSYEQNSIDAGIYLNGKYVKIGYGQDLLYSDADDKIISISIKDSDKNDYTWNMIYDANSDFLKLDPIYSNINKKNLDLNLFNNNFEYIAAERTGPKLSYDKSYYDVHVRNQLGIHGEYAANYLYDKRENKIFNKNTKHPDENSDFLQTQVEKWISEISPGVKLSFENYRYANSISLMVKQEGDSISNYYPALNVGFGISYVLPVIISLLKANKGDLVIIENPEAHLHPKGQRKMGELISYAASGGVQVLIETHSDHILNGIRLSVKNGYLLPGNVKLYYFNRVLKDKYMEHNVEEPTIKKDGRLTYWPEGFFDEWDKAIDEIF